MSISVEDHYSSTGIVDRILAAIPFVRGSDPPLMAAQLFPFDQFHGREILATRDHAALLAPKPGDHVLDIGSGIGGPARYIATTMRAQVTGIDLTPGFVDAANELAGLCSLSEWVTFLTADAANLPFEDAQFDHAICFYVGMNLAFKPAVLAQCLRVLKPQGRLVWTEVVLGAGDPVYPLPWATTPETSHLLSRDALLTMMQTAGFIVDDTRDETRDHIDLAQKMQQSGAQASPLQMQANAVVLGQDFVQRRKNYIQSLACGAISSLCIQAHKPAKT
ncbi:MAG: methyltransferase domain-containing protein [Paracoccaceae bacterium]|nr:methyltransferase domain-containing protein [Paracoccaceae bacterium]